jgi:serine/threonine protein kinase
MATASAELPRTFGPYELVRKLASGAVVDVFFAQARSVAGFQKAVAVKMIRAAHEDDDPEFVRQLVDEANIASRLSHKNIVQVIDLGEIDRQHYIAMEYVDGIDLSQLLTRLGSKRNALAPRVAAYIIREVCEGLDHAHRKCDDTGTPLRIVHRDVSPPNVLLSFTGEVKLTDFGLAKASLRAANTQAGEIKGKYAYMAPEQARGQAVDARTDVFAAALVLYELVAGRAAYPSAPLPIMLERLTRGLIEPIETVRPNLPPTLVSIMKRAASADASQRHPSARALADDLTNFLYTQPAHPETELSQLLESCSHSARSHLAPLGTNLVDDPFEEITSLGAARSNGSHRLNGAAPRSNPPPAADMARVRYAQPAPSSAPPAAVTHVFTDSVAPLDADEALDLDAPTELIPSQPSPQPALAQPRVARPAVPTADDHPTEVMDGEGPDAELLATAAAIAPLAMRPSPPPPQRVSPSPPQRTSQPPAARPAAPVAAPPRRLSPDVTAPVPRRSIAPRRHTLYLTAIGVGLCAGLAVALLLMWLSR